MADDPTPTNDDNATPEPTPEPTPTPEPEAPSVKDLLRWADPEVRNASVMQTVPEQVGEFLKEYAGLKQLAGRKGIAEPNWENPEEVASFYREHLGTPADPAGYDFSEVKRPEGLPWDEGLQKQMAEWMHKRNVPAEMAKGLMEDYTNLESQAFAEEQTRRKQVQEETFAALRKELGTQYEPYVADAKAVYQEFAEKAGIPIETIDNLKLDDGRRLGDTDFAIRIFGEIAKSRGEHAAHFGRAPALAGRTPEQAKQELSKMALDPEAQSALLNPMHPRRKEFQEKRDQLYQEVAAGEGSQ